MDTQDAAPGYHIWGIDNASYGPVELPVLVNWIKEERVVADTWIFAENANGWFRASELPDVAMLFHSKRSAEAPTTTPDDIKPGALRRIRALAEMSDEHLLALLRYIEVVEVRPFTHLVRKGDPGDAMYGVLEGELRSCIEVDGKEVLLTTLGPGGVFGEISLFDKGPHAADAITNVESVLVKISATAIATFSKEAPDAAFAFLLGLIKAVAGRVRTLTRKYEDSVHGANRTQALHGMAERTANSGAAYV